MIRPHPPKFRINRRKTVSVTPAIGANTVAGAILTGPIENRVGKELITLAGVLSISNAAVPSDSRQGNATAAACIFIA
jgi:hypothetical protein